MGHALELTIAYLSTRSQFGVKLSTFQALRHQLSQAYVDYENARAQWQAALAAWARGELTARTTALLQLSMARIGRTVAQSVIQLHGGMGMTEELLAARLAKRLIVNAFENSGLAAARAQIGQDATQEAIQ